MNFIVKLCVFFIIGATTIYYVSQYVTVLPSPAYLGLIPLLLFPANYCIQVIMKLVSSDSHPLLTTYELSKLTPLIERKKAQIERLLLFYSLAALLIAIGCLMTPAFFYRQFLAITGGLIIASVYSLTFIRSVASEIHRLEFTLNQRDKYKNS
ncbi:hypothetical protein [Tatumella saanichensis]|uniref:hypothetical protein n=1 Tax=Tatumella saanichensis TaxID=480813 RepID=UPI0004A4A73E|nr:hypothetical protein [Tatumella saanichensis]